MKKWYHASKNIEHRESKTNEWEIENAERRITKPFKSFEKSCVCLFQNQILHIKEYIEPDCGFHIIPRSSNFLWRYHGLINKVYVTHTRFEMILEGLVTHNFGTTKEPKILCSIHNSITTFLFFFNALLYTKFVFKQ